MLWMEASDRTKQAGILARRSAPFRPSHGSPAMAYSDRLPAHSDLIAQAFTWFPFYISSARSKQIWLSASILQEIYTCLVHFLTKTSISYPAAIGNPVFTNFLSFTFLSDYLSIGYSQSIPAALLTGPGFATYQASPHFLLIASRNCSRRLAWFS